MKEAVTKINSDMELMITDLNELEEGLVTLIKYLVERLGRFRENLDAVGGDAGNESEVET